MSTLLKDVLDPARREGISKQHSVSSAVSSSDWSSIATPTMQMQVQPSLEASDSGFSEDYRNLKAARERLYQSMMMREEASAGGVTVTRPWLLELLHELKKRKEMGSIQLRDDNALARELSKRQEAEELRFSAKDLAEALRVLPPAVQERLDRMRAVTVNANVASSSVIGDGSFTELHVENSVRRLRYKMEGRGRDEDLVDQGEAGRNFLLAEFERQHRAAIKIQASFRGYRDRRRIKGTWPDDSNRWLGHDTQARYMAAIGHQRQAHQHQVPGTPNKKKDLTTKKSSEEVALSLSLAEVMVARIEAAAEQRTAEGIMRVPIGGKSSRYLMNDREYRRIVLGEDYTETPEEAEERKAREYEEWRRKKEVEEEAYRKKQKAREEAISSLVSALLEEAKLDSRMEAARLRAAAEDMYTTSHPGSQSRRRSSTGFTSLAAESSYGSTSRRTSQDGMSRRTSFVGSSEGSSHSMFSHAELIAEIQRREIITRIDARLGYLGGVLHVSMDELQTLKGQISGLEDGLSKDVRMKLSELLEVVEADVLEVIEQERRVQGESTIDVDAKACKIPLKSPSKAIADGKRPVDPRLPLPVPKFQPPIFAKEAALLKASVLPHVPLLHHNWGPSNASPLKPAAEPPSRIFPSPVKPARAKSFVYAGSILRKNKEGDANKSKRRAYFSETNAEREKPIKKESSRLSVKLETDPSLVEESSEFVPVTQVILTKILQELKKRGLRPPERLQDQALSDLPSGAWVLLDDMKEALKRLPPDVSKRLEKEAISAASETEEEILRKHVGTVFANTDSIIFSFDSSPSGNPTISSGFDRRAREEVLLSGLWLSSFEEALDQHDIEPTVKVNRVFFNVARNPYTPTFWTPWADVLSLIAKLPYSISQQLLADADEFVQSITPEMVEAKSLEDPESLVCIQKEDLLDLLSELQEAGEVEVPASLVKDKVIKEAVMDLAERLAPGPIKSFICSLQPLQPSAPSSLTLRDSPIFIPRVTLVDLVSEEGPLHKNITEGSRTKDLAERFKKAMSVPRRAAVEVAVDKKWLRFFVKEAEAQGVDLMPTLIESYRSTTTNRPMSAFGGVVAKRDDDGDSEDDGIGSSIYENRCWVMKDDIDVTVSRLPPQSLARLAVVTQRCTLINDALNHSGLDKRIAAEILVESEWLQDLAFELKIATGLVPKSLGTTSRPQSGLPSSVRWISVADVETSLLQLPAERAEHLVSMAEEAMQHSPALMVEAAHAFVAARKEDVVSLISEAQARGVASLEPALLNERRFSTRRLLFSLINDLPPGPLKDHLASEKEKAFVVMQRMDSLQGPVISAPEGTMHIPRAALSKLLARVSAPLAPSNDDESSEELDERQFSHFRKSMSMPHRPAVEVNVDIRWLKELVRELKMAEVKVPPVLLEPSLNKIRTGKKDLSSPNTCWLMQDDVDDALFQLSPESITRLSLMMRYILLQGKVMLPNPAPLKASVTSIGAKIVASPVLPALPSFPPQAVQSNQTLPDASEAQRLAQVIEIRRPYQGQSQSDEPSDLLKRRLTHQVPAVAAGGGGQLKISVVDYGGSGSSRVSVQLSVPTLPHQAQVSPSEIYSDPASVAVININDNLSSPQARFSQQAMPGGPIFRAFPRQSMEGQLPTLSPGSPGKLDQAAAANRVALSMDIWRRAQFDIQQYRGEVGPLSPHLSYEKQTKPLDENPPTSLGLDSQRYAAGLEGEGLPVVVGVSALDLPDDTLPLLPVARTSMVGGLSSPHGLNKTLNDTLSTLRNLARVSEGGLPPPLAASKSLGSLSPTRQARTSMSGAFPSASSPLGALGPQQSQQGLPSLASPLGRVSRTSITGGLSPMRNRASTIGGSLSATSDTLQLNTAAEPKLPSFLPKLK